MTRYGQLIFSLIVSLAVVSPAAAQWKWKDKDGRVQYSDVPPPSSVKESDILQQPSAARRLAPATPAPAASATPSAAPSASGGTSAPKVDPELEARRKKTEELENAKKKEEEQKIAAARKENCSQARAHMKTLDEGFRIARTNANGEREVLDDADRAVEAKRTREAINSNCK